MIPPQSFTANHQVSGTWLSLKLAPVVACDFLLTFSSFPSQLKLLGSHLVPFLLTSLNSHQPIFYFGCHNLFSRLTNRLSDGSHGFPWMLSILLNASKLTHFLALNTSEAPDVEIPCKDLIIPGHGFYLFQALLNSAPRMP